MIGLTIARKLSLRSTITAAAEIKSVGLEDVKGLVRGVVVMSLTIELAAAVILSLRFLTGYSEPVGRAICLGVFHAVSSFNNAGFALFSDNLISFPTDPFVCLPIAFAVILGGIGFPVIVQLRRLRRADHGIARTDPSTLNSDEQREPSSGCRGDCRQSVCAVLSRLHRVAVLGMTGCQVEHPTGLSRPSPRWKDCRRA
ncbi:potassium transporter TrkG [Cryobacterium tagatosivorans]|uniref:potassium transporter TrkG n=1 Tax=Cryobacterium tagatosivorans TaxID=1259199 RepID=UPI0018E0716B|nr:potassium transporter TrkG [Cryobacterium tagatosivorans]